MATERRTERFVRGSMSVDGKIVQVGIMTLPPSSDRLFAQRTEFPFQLSPDGPVFTLDLLYQERIVEITTPEEDTDGVAERDDDYYE